MEKKLNKQFGIRICENQIKNLEEIACAEQRSVAAVIRMMIDEGIEKKKADSGKVKRTSEL
jgi:hypothetical protein